jgi:TPP-dependent pyruvate/acetoin dehydrogenase alpha subunit
LPPTTAITGHRYMNESAQPGTTPSQSSARPAVPRPILETAFRRMAQAKAMTELYEANFKLVSKYVHATSRGHEAIQLAVGLQLLPQDFAYPYYRDDSMLLGIGLRPYDLMLQLMAKRDDPFSGGRSYYCHPSLRDDRYPKIPHQSSATGMQAIPATGAALGLWYKEASGPPADTESPIVVCSLGDASVTEGEVSEAFQMAVLKKLPILYLVQDNGWDISANAAETRVANAVEYARGFPGLEAVSIEGNDFGACWASGGPSSCMRASPCSTTIPPACARSGTATTWTSTSAAIPIRCCGTWSGKPGFRKPRSGRWKKRPP